MKLITRMQEIDFSGYSYKKEYACSPTANCSRCTRLMYLLIHMEQFGFETFSKYLASNHKEINRCNEDEWSVLNIAARNATRPHYLDAMRLLLKAGAEVNGSSKNPKAFTPLMHAARNASTNSCLDAVKMLIDAGADINVVRSGMTPLSWTVKYIEKSSTVETVKLLLDSGANVNFLTGDDKTILMLATCNVKSAAGLKVVEMLLEHGADINARGDAMTVLMTIKYGKIESSYAIDAIKLLLKYGASVLDVDDKGWTLLATSLNYKPVQKWSVEITDIYLAAGADPMALTNDGWTPLMIAMQEIGEFSIDIISRLIDRGADVNFQANNHQTALTVAITNLEDVDLAAVEYLLDRGANPNILGVNDKSALAIAIDNADDNPKYLEVIDLLIRKGADITKCSLLNLVISNKKCPPIDKIVEMLLDAGANPFDKPSPLDLALKQEPSVKIIRVIRLLLSYGAPPIQDFDLLLKFNRKCKVSSNDVVKIMLNYIIDINPMKLSVELTDKQKKYALSLYVQREMAKLMMRKILQQIANVSRKVMHHPDSLRVQLMSLNHALSEKIYQESVKNQNSVVTYINASNYENFCWKIRDIVSHID